MVSVTPFLGPHGKSYSGMGGHSMRIDRNRVWWTRKHPRFLTKGGNEKSLLILFDHFCILLHFAEGLPKFNMLTGTKL